MWAVRVATAPENGAGHAVRTASLLQALGQPVILFTDPGPLPEPLLLLKASQRVEEAGPEGCDRFLEYVTSGGTTRALIDGYRFSEESIAAVADHAPLAVFRDDGRRGREMVSLAPGPLNIHDAGWLAGPSYITVQGAVAGARPDREPTPRSLRTVLVSFGARDSVDCTGLVLSVLGSLIDRLALTVVMSANAPHKEAVSTQLARMSAGRLVVDPPSLVPFLRKADLAIGAPGVSQAERACLGVPTILVPQNEAQVPLAAAWSDLGTAIPMARSALPSVLPGLLTQWLDDPQPLTDMARRAWRTVDGKGVQRLAAGLDRLLVALERKGH